MKPFPVSKITSIVVLLLFTLWGVDSFANAYCDSITGTSRKRDCNAAVAACATGPGAARSACEAGISLNFPMTPPAPTTNRQTTPAPTGPPAGAPAYYSQQDPLLAKCSVYANPSDAYTKCMTAADRASCSTAAQAAETAYGLAIKSCEDAKGAASAGAGGTWSCRQAVEECEDADEEMPGFVASLMQGAMAGSFDGSLSGGDGPTCESLRGISVSDFNQEKRDAEQLKRDAKKDQLDAAEKKIKGEEEYQKDVNDIQKQARELLKDVGDKKHEDEVADAKESADVQKTLVEIKQHTRDAEKKIMAIQEAQLQLPHDKANAIAQYNAELNACNNKIQLAQLEKSTFKIAADANSAKNLGANRKARLQKAWEDCVNPVINRLNQQQEAFKTKKAQLENELRYANEDLQDAKAERDLFQATQTKMVESKNAQRQREAQNNLTAYSEYMRQQSQLDTIMMQKRQNNAQNIARANSDYSDAMNRLKYYKSSNRPGSKTSGEANAAISNYTSLSTNCAQVCTDAGQQVPAGCSHKAPAGSGSGSSSSGGTP